MNSHPSSVSMRSMVLDGGGAPAITTRTVPRPGTARPFSRRGVEHGRNDGGRAVEQRDALGLDALQDLLAVDLPDDDLARAHRGERVRHAPAVAVEGGQR